MRPPGPLEIGLILLIVLIIFGAGKLPQVFRAAGQGLREFQKAKEGEFDEDKPAEKSKRRKSTKKS
jgi:sec-independent protein translocase protein TatA